MVRLLVNIEIGNPLLQGIKGIGGRHSQRGAVAEYVGCCVAVDPMSKEMGVPWQNGFIHVPLPGRHCAIRWLAACADETHHHEGDKVGRSHRTFSPMHRLKY